MPKRKKPTQQDAILQELGITDAPNSKAVQLTKPPSKQVSKTSFNRQNIKPNTYNQADLLFLPNDDGYKYLLVDVELSSRHIQAVPLKSKASSDVLKAIQKIYGRNGKNGKWKLPVVFQVDAGSEFNATNKWLKEHNVTVRVAATGRHSQQSVVEKANRRITAIITRLQSHHEFATGEEDTSWVEYIPRVIPLLNKHVSKVEYQPNQIKTNPYVNCKGKECETYAIGEKVYVALDIPENIKEQRLHNTFREGDRRWSLKTYEIKNILLYPNRPIRYVVDKHTQNVFTKNQLKPASQVSNAPVRSLKQVKDDNNDIKYQVKSLLKKKKMNGKIYYLVSWVGYTEKTYEPRSQLMKDVPLLVKEFEKKHKR